MPDKNFKGADGHFRVLAQGLHGHRAIRDDYQEMSDEEAYRDIDMRRNSLDPTEIDFEEGDQTIPDGYQRQEGSWED